MIGPLALGTVVKGDHTIREGHKIITSYALCLYRHQKPTLRPCITSQRMPGLVCLPVVLLVLTRRMPLGHSTSR